MEQTQKKLAIVFLLIALLSFVFSIVCFAMETDQMWGTSNVPSQTYGGDAYTGIQNAAASTSNNTYRVGENISNLAKCITTISGFMFIIVGATFGTLGWYKLKILDVANPSKASNGQECVGESNNDKTQEESEH